MTSGSPFRVCSEPGCSDNNAPRYHHCYRHLTAAEHEKIITDGAAAREQIAAKTHQVQQPGATSPEGWYDNPDGAGNLR